MKPNGWVRGAVFKDESFPSAKSAEDYSKRLRLFTANRKCDDYGETTLQDFAAFAAGLGWEGLPLELVQSASPEVSTGEADDSGEGAARPQLLHPAQEDEILRIIESLGHSPLALPRRTPGQPWVKAAVLEKAPKWMKQGTVFKKAWDRLRQDKRIKEA
ncbi:hypothetical protein [Uliginosibacterium sp. TH139]|uniref:hypothetical protein n=1 Tax=Uliginosibacterium sp. TH139 TaxID=2067453 RepID=UPI00117F7233|nr:hypothetical protein [Uliginosibacterium sp. TH139]